MLTDCNRRQSAECQTDDRPNHKLRCRRDAPRYNALDDTGLILGNTVASAGERTLKELNIVYRRIIVNQTIKKLNNQFNS